MPPRTQALLLAVAFVLGGLVAGVFLLTQFESSHREQRALLARETVANLSAAVVHDAIARDALSLTVVLRDALERGVVTSAAVYDDTGGLLVTVGARARDAELFTHEIRTRDTVVGRLQITIVEAEAPGLDWLFLPSAVLALLVLGVWQWARLLPTTRNAPGPEEEELPVLHEQVQLFDDQSLASALVVKVEPPRRADELESRVRELANQHSAELTRTGSEFCLLGESPADAVTIALSLDDGTPAHVTLRMGVDSAPDEEEAALLKRARYLASLSTGGLLVSQSVFDGLTPGDFTVERFHSSFAEEDIYEVA